MGESSISRLAEFAAACLYWKTRLWDESQMELRQFNCRNIFTGPTCAYTWWATKCLRARSRAKQWTTAIRARSQKSRESRRVRSRRRFPTDASLSLGCLDCLLPASICDAGAMDDGYALKRIHRQATPSTNKR